MRQTNCWIITKWYDEWGWKKNVMCEVIYRAYKSWTTSIHWMSLKLNKKCMNEMEINSKEYMIWGRGEKPFAMEVNIRDIHPTTVQDRSFSCCCPNETNCSVSADKQHNCVSLFVRPGGYLYLWTQLLHKLASFHWLPFAVYLSENRPLIDYRMRKHVPGFLFSLMSPFNFRSCIIHCVAWRTPRSDLIQPIDHAPRRLPPIRHTLYVSHVIKMAMFNFYQKSSNTSVE